MVDIPHTDYNKYLHRAYLKRSDIKALKDAYASEEAHVYQEVLSQFPLLSLRTDIARDTSNIHTLGMGLSFGLTLLTQNKANIDKAKASRDQVYFEYQARLNQVRTDIKSSLLQREVLQKERLTLLTNLPNLKQVASDLEKAMEKGDQTFWSYEAMRSTILSCELKLLTLQESIIEEKINLQLAVGQSL